MSIMPPSCGIALCTYNGARFLAAQLDSIKRQTCPIAEMVIHDDGSSDGSWELLEQWAAQAPFPVHLQRHGRQLGAAKNFETALAALHTDLIFLCDQDDVWMPDKLQRLCDRFAAEQDLMLIHTNAILLDANGVAMKRTLFDALELQATEKNFINNGQAHTALRRRNLVTGATTAFRRRLLDHALPFPTHVLHDEWLGVVACMMGKLALLPEPTMFYRQHEGNLVGAPRRYRFKSLKNFLWHIRQPDSRAPLRRRFSYQQQVQARALRAARGNRSLLVSIRQTHDFAGFRCSLPSQVWRRASMLYRHWRAGHYHQFTDTPWTDLLRDLIQR
ncbi:MAG: glycosyltransferase family 2 protein [Janthinobacterium lividum]